MIPIEPFPKFLGHELDPKLNFKNHLSMIEEKVLSKINMIRKLKGMNLKNNTYLSLIVYKSLIRSTNDRHASNQKRHSKTPKPCSSNYTILPFKNKNQ